MGKLIKIEELLEGAVLDKDVTNPQGAVLLKAGNAVSQKHIDIFKTWGVKSVSVQETVSTEDLGGRTPQEVADEKIKSLDSALNEKFSDVGDDEIMQKIKEIAFRHRSIKIKEKYNV